MRFAWKSVHSEYATACCRMTSEFIIWASFFEAATSKGVVLTSVTSSSCNAILQNHVTAALQDRSCLTATVLMQDWASPDIAVPVKQLLGQTFGKDHIIIRNLKNSWPS